jgi:HlyD family secretion protein
VKVDKAKIRVIKTGIQDDTNIEGRVVLKRRCCDGTVYDCFKDLNSGDMVYVKSENDKEKANSFSLDLYFANK